MNARNNNFALLHYIAALWVILGHTFVLLGKNVPTILNASIHEMGVNVLFVISGFLVSRSFLRDSRLKSFWLKRLMRIYPPLIVCIVLTAVGGFFLSDLPLAAYIPGAKVYIKDNLLMRPQFYLPGIFSENPYPIAVNGSLWTLPIELVCFLLLPVCLLAVKKVKKKISVYALAAALMSCLGIYINQYCVGKMLVFWATDWMQAVRLFAFFLWGVTFSMFSQEEIKRWCRGDMAIILLCIALSIGSHYPRMLNYFIIPYMVISFAFSGDGIFQEFLNKHDYVYGLYLWAFPVQQTLIYLFRQKLPSVWVLFTLSVCLTLCLAVLTNKIVEEPVSKLVKCLTK